MNEGLSDGTPARMPGRGRVTVHKGGEECGDMQKQVFSHSWLWAALALKKKRWAWRRGKKPAVTLQKQGRRRLQTAPHARLVLLQDEWPFHFQRLIILPVVVACTDDLMHAIPVETTLQAGGCDGSSLRLSTCLQTSNKEKKNCH